MVKRPSIRLLSTWILAAALLTAVAARAGEPDATPTTVPISTTSKDVSLPPAAQLPLAMQIRMCLGAVLRILPLP
jgi:hypothetical protein